MPIYNYKCADCGYESDELRPISKREIPLPCPECQGERYPLLSTAHWNWGTAAAAHGMFVEETRKGYHGVTHAPKRGRGGTREEIMSR